MSTPFIVHPDTHLDHGLTLATLRWLLKQGQQQHDELGFGEGHNVILTWELPRNVDGIRLLECGLYGPIMGDAPIPETACVMEQRPGRPWASRRLRDRTPRLTDKVTIVVGPYESYDAVLFTAYGGPIAPREPGDPSIANDLRLLEESRKFWSEHALVW